MSTTVSRALAAALRLDGQPDLPVTALVRHDAALPQGVRVVVVIDDDSAFDLLLDRDLLTSGVVTGADGDGPVQVQVVGEQVLLGAADLTLALPLHPVIDLLLATYAAAPTGQDGDLVVALEARSRTSA